MTRLLLIPALITLTACGGTSVPVQVSSAGSLNNAPVTVPAIPVSNTGNTDASFASLLNNVRLSNGAGTVTYNAELDAAAQSHAADMLANNYFSHTGLDGSSAADRARAAGYNYRALGENIAAGYQSESSVMAGWTGSPGHHANNINPTFEDFGLGYAANGGSTRWVLMLGAER